MSRKVYVNVTTRLVINADEGVDISEVIQEMECDFVSNSKGANVENIEIVGHEITDSK